MSEEKSEPLVVPHVKESKRITETLLCRKCIKQFGPNVDEVIKRQHLEAGFIGNRNGIQIWCLIHEEVMATLEIENVAPPGVRGQEPCA